MGGAPSGVGPALAQPGHQHVASASGHGQQRVIAPLAGVAVVARPFLDQTVGLADGGVQVDGEWRVVRSGSSRPGPGQQFPAHPVQLADMAPTEAAQKGPQGGWRLDHAADGASRPAGAQHVSVVDAVSSGQSRSHQRHHLVAGVGSAWGATQVQVPVNQFGQAQMLAQRGWQQQPRIGHQAVIIKGNVDAVGVRRC